MKYTGRGRLLLLIGWLLSYSVSWAQTQKLFSTGLVDIAGAIPPEGEAAVQEALEELTTTHAFRLPLVTYYYGSIFASFLPDNTQNFLKASDPALMVVVFTEPSNLDYHHCQVAVTPALEDRLSPEMAQHLMDHALRRRAEALPGQRVRPAAGPAGRSESPGRLPQWLTPSGCHSHHHLCQSQRSYPHPRRFGCLHEAHRGNYEQREINEESYPVAWKALPSGQSNTVLAQVAEDVSFPPGVVFKQNDNTIPTQPAAQTHQQQLNLIGQGHEQEGSVSVYASDSEEAELVGQLNTISYDVLPKKLVLVPLNGNLDRSELWPTVERVARIYQQAAVHLEVAIGEPVMMEGWEWDDPLDDGTTGLLSNYTKEMRQVIRAFRRQQDTDPETAYIFLGYQSQSGKKGYMPKKRSYGFVFNEPHRNHWELSTTIAHELGHGLFRLEHTFDSYPSLTKSSTNNLMDYGGGIKLRKYQWDLIHNPEAMLGLFQDEEENAYYSPDLEDTWAKNLLTIACAGSRKVSQVDIEVRYEMNQSRQGAGTRNAIQFELNGLPITIKVDELPRISTYQVNLSSQQLSNSGEVSTFSYDLVGTDKKLSFSVPVSQAHTLSGWLASPPESLFQQLVDDIPTSEGDPVYSALSRLPGCAYELIRPETRVQYIDWMVNDELTTNEHQEALILRLLEEVKTEDMNRLVSALEAYDDWEGLLESFDEITTQQGLFRALLSLYQGTTSQEAQQDIRAVFDFNALNHTSTLLDHIATVEVGYTPGKLNFSRAISKASWTPYGLQDVTRSSSPCAATSLFDPVLVIVDDDHTNLGLQPGTQLRSIPAVLAAFFIEKKDSEINKQLASTALDVALLGAGVGEVSIAIKAYRTASTVRTLFRLTLAVADVATAYTDLACQFNDTELCNEWKQVSFYLQIGLLSLNTVDGLETLIRKTDEVAKGAKWSDDFSSTTGITIRKATDDEILAKAKQWQGKGDYPGVDDWEVYEIPVGTKIYGGLPGQSEFYSTFDNLQSVRFDKVKYWESLQVKPNAIHGFRPKVGEYTIKKDIKVAISRTLANPQFGRGGGWQVFVENFSDDLEFVKEIKLE